MPPDTTKPITSPFGRPDLRDRRKALGLTLPQVAAAAGIDHALVARVEHGVRQTAAGPVPHCYPAATVDRVETVLREAERTGSLPRLPRAGHPGESPAAYRANPKRCDHCDRPIPLRGRRRPSECRKQRYCSWRCAVRTAQARAAAREAARR